MEIPKTCSAPLNPTAPSLLTLPAEIRNRISEYIFMQPEPILIHNADFYYDRRPCGHDSARGRRNNWTNWKTTLITQRYDAQLFKHGASLGLGLLKSCRQIYHETASILYTGNVFVISRVRYVSNHVATEVCDGSQCHDYNQLRYAPVWLASLGSQTKRIKKVLIDISAVCKHRGCYTEDFPDILPLLRMIWNGDLARCDVTFAYTSRRTSDGPWSKTPQMLRATATRLNRALVALINDDTLDLRRLSALKSLLSSLNMDSHGIGGSVQYYTGPRSVFRGFKINTESGKAVWDAAEPATSLMDIPLQAQGIICRYVVTHGKSLRLVLNSRNPLNCDRNLFDVSATWRNSLTRAVSTSMPIIIELLAARAHTDYNNSDLSRSFYPDTEALSNCDGLINQIIEECVRIRSETAQVTLSIRVRLTRPTNPTDVRINIDGLLFWLQSVKHKPVKDDVRLAIELERAEGDESHYEISSTTVGKLKMELFLYFTDILDQTPGDGEAGPELPELWMNGRAHLVDLAPLPMGYPFSQKGAIKSEAYEENFRRAMRKIEADHTVEDMAECCLYSAEDCVYHTWLSLQRWAKSVRKNERSCRGSDKQEQSQ